MKKGVEERLANGVIAVAYLDLVLLLSVITDIDFVRENLIFILPPVVVISMVIGWKLNKNYDKSDNYDSHFSFILFLLVCILIAGGFLVNR